MEVQAEKDIEEYYPNAKAPNLSDVDVFNRPKDSITVVRTQDDPAFEVLRYKGVPVENIPTLSGNTDKVIAYDDQAEGNQEKSAMEARTQTGFPVPTGKPRKQRSDAGQPRGSYKERQFEKGLLTGYQGAQALSSASDTDTDAKYRRQILKAEGFAQRKNVEGGFAGKFDNETAVMNNTNNNPVKKPLAEGYNDTPSDTNVSVDSLLFE